VLLWVQALQCVRLQRQRVMNASASASQSEAGPSALTARLRKRFKLLLPVLRFIKQPATGLQTSTSSSFALF
jgi:hypothetical protein